MVLVPLVIVFGKVGRGIGLPQLFRRPSVYDRLFIGAGVGILIRQASLAGYLFEEFATNSAFDRPPFCEQRRLGDEPADAAGDAVRYRLPLGDPARPADPALKKDVDELAERVTRSVEWFVA